MLLFKKKSKDHVYTYNGTDTIKMSHITVVLEFINKILLPYISHKIIKFAIVAHNFFLYSY